MAFDAFLWIDDLDGESTDQRVAGLIELIDFGLAVRQTVSSTNSSSGDASAERVDFSPFLLKKQVDTTSPKLALACAAGTHIDKIIIAICRAGSSKLKFMEYRLLNCIISKFRAYGGHQTGYPFPTESVGIDYGQIQWHYLPQTRRGGAVTGSYVTGWDLQTNKKQ